jgi:hypothetical protein
MRTVTRTGIIQKLPQITTPAYDPSVVKYHTVSVYTYCQSIVLEPLFLPSSSSLSLSLVEEDCGANGVSIVHCCLIGQ